MEVAAVKTCRVTDVDLAGAEPATGSRPGAGTSAIGAPADGAPAAGTSAAGTSAAGDQACAQDPGWTWGGAEDGIPADAPLPALLLAASRVMGAFYAGTVAQAGLRISPAGLGVLRVLLAGDGSKSSDVAARGWSSPGTLTAVVDTLVREGYVERRRDAGDRRVVRLYVTDKGRRICEDYYALAGPQWQAAFSFVSPADEPVIRKFFVDMIGHFGEMVRKERGR
jgi:MarR family transcriptional regulator, organic hydroperoxide resistance regulator